VFSSLDFLMHRLVPIECCRDLRACARGEEPPETIHAGKSRSRPQVNGPNGNAVADEGARAGMFGTGV